MLRGEIAMSNILVSCVISVLSCNRHTYESKVWSLRKWKYVFYFGNNIYKPACQL